MDDYDLIPTKPGYAADVVAAADRDAVQAQARAVLALVAQLEAACDEALARRAVTQPDGVLVEVELDDITGDAVPHFDLAPSSLFPPVMRSASSQCLDAAVQLQRYRAMFATAASAVRSGARGHFDAARGRTRRMRAA